LGVVGLLRERLDKLSSAIARRQKERERLTTAYLRSILGVDEYEDRMAGLADSLAQMKQESTSVLRDLQAMPDVQVRAEELEELIPEMLRALRSPPSPEALRELLHRTFRRVEVDAGQVVSVVVL
jgi:chromosome segregation ATPase